MVKKAKKEAVQVTRAELPDDEFIVRLKSSCAIKESRGAFGACSFDQCLALTAKKSDERMDWRELERMLTELVRSGRILSQNGKFYPIASKSEIAKSIKYATPLEVKSSAEKAKNKPRDGRQVEMFL